jgi:hypothetical protein
VRSEGRGARIIANALVGVKRKSDYLIVMDYLEGARAALAEDRKVDASLLSQVGREHDDVVLE